MINTVQTSTFNYNTTKLTYTVFERGKLEVNLSIHLSHIFKYGNNN